ncbi:MAG TPA: M20/M25/M40 family metallo-hydrolase, partial [Thermoanaerobaculia bacterium]|nr:M20/M25/M40 family metallo-hydrolase [Thermoanaerobaculia bacterium]
MRTVAAALTLLVLVSLPLSAQGRPDLRIDTTEKFSAAAIPPYTRNHDEVYEYIDRNLDRHLEALQRWVRQPSISAQDVGIDAMAEMLRRDLLAIGFAEAELAPTSGHPGVFGYYDAGAAKTLIVYLMYDVQPVEPDEWRVDPFAGSIVDHELGRVLMARGATNQKGPERAFLNAVEAIHAVRGRLPVNLLVVAEGEEELGSPHYSEVIDRYESRLRRADGVLFPFNSQDSAGEVTMSLGVKGIVYFEMEAVGNEKGGPQRAEVHGSLKALVDSPVWRLVQALATLTSPDGNTIAVPGYYDPIRPPTREEQRLLSAALDDWTGREERMKSVLGVAEWIDGIGDAEALLRLLYDTTLNIDGIWGGYSGEGTKTILPHKATAKVDSRLVPDQTPEGAMALIRSHLDANGFEDVAIRLMAGYPPAQTSVEAALVEAAISV